MKSWRAEFSANVEVIAEGIQSKMEMPSKETAPGPNLLRREMTLAGTPVLIICDGVNTWNYAPALKPYQRTPDTGAACVSTFTSWA